MDTLTEQQTNAVYPHFVGSVRRKRPLAGRYPTIANAIAACVVPIVYLSFVAHYAVDVPEVDEWHRVPFLDNALHGHVTMSALWAVFPDGRIFVGSLIYVVSAFVDRFDVRVLILFNAGIFICAFWIFLAICRAYRGGKIGVLSILVISVIWFSLANVENALDGTQDPFLVLFFFIAMIYFLTVPPRHRSFFVGLAAFSAIAASCTALQGFVLWPVGLICLLWTRPWGRRNYLECGSWISIGVITLALYTIGLGLNPRCPGTLKNTCSLKYTVHHPEAAVRFLLDWSGTSFPPDT